MPKFAGSSQAILHSRLSFMMFLHFFSLGAITPIFSLYLIRVLGFQGTQVGMILAMGSLAMVVTPLITALVADKYVSGRHLLAILNFLSALAFYFLISSQDFTSVLWFYTLAMAAKGPTFALSNSITFQNVTDSQKHFPRIRLWGTIGWIAAGWLFSFLWIQDNGGGTLSTVIILAALASFILGIYSLTLPDTPLPLSEVIPTKNKENKKNPLGRDLISFLLVTVIISAADKFYFFGASIFLSQLSWDDKWILPVMSLGQVAEVIALVFLSRILPRLGFRKVFLLGAALQVLRFALLAWVRIPWEIMVTISLHGLCFSFFFANAFVYIDSRTTKANRAKVHQLYIFLVEGVGVTLGNFSAGITAQSLTVSSKGGIDFSLFWLIPGALTLISFGILGIFFRPKTPVVSS